MTEQEILNKYPKIFIEKDLPNTQTCMCWGLEVPDDWLPVIDTLCWSLQNTGYVSQHIKTRPQVVAEQVKSKFRSLRFYYRVEWPDEASSEEQARARERYESFIDGQIHLAENLIGKIERERRKNTQNEQI